MNKDYYALLGVEQDASPEDIKRAYRKRAMKVHPDVAPGEDAADKFKELTEAYEVLSDPNKRAIYDRGGDPTRQSGAGFSGFTGGFAGGFDFSTLVDAVFGASAGGQGPRPRKRAGQDALVPIAVELHEAVFGTTKPITVQTAVVCPRCHGGGGEDGSAPVTCQTCAGHGQVTQIQRSFLGDIRTAQPCPSCRGYGNVIPKPCGECAGEGRVRSTRTVSVRMPAGVDTGTRVRLEGQGEVGPGGGPAGDLYVEVNVRPHETFTRVEDDLQMVVKVPMTAAALGTRIDVETLEAEWEKSALEDRHVSLEIPAGTQSGTRLTVAGKGAPRRRGGGRGDLIVTLLVQTPTKLDEKQRDLLRSLAELRNEKAERVSASHPKGGFRNWLKDAFG